MPRICIAVLGLVFALSATTPGALAQSNSYKQTNLTSDTAGVAANVDPNLVNPWGIAYFPNNPFWIADNNSGFTTLYNASGMNAGSFPLPAAANTNSQVLVTYAMQDQAKHDPVHQAGAGILLSGLLTSRQSARFQGSSAALLLLPTETGGAVMGVREPQGAEELFIGQPRYLVATPNKLAREADAARRER